MVGRFAFGDGRQIKRIYRRPDFEKGRWGTGTENTESSEDAHYVTGVFLEEAW